MSLAKLHPWTVTAVNLAEHGRNPIHTDEGARAAGFPKALVAGVSTYAYLTHPPVAAWSEEWICSGGSEVKFTAPVFDGDEITCQPVRVNDDLFVDAIVDGESRVRSRMWNEPHQLSPNRSGEDLPPMTMELNEDWVTYGVRLGDEASLYVEGGIVHPAAWPALANEVMAKELVTGAWIHTRSAIQHHGVAHLGSTAVIESTLIDRFSSRLGERAIVDMTISADGQPVATIEHEAIVSLQ